MKLLKILLSTMFLFTAVIRSATVGECGSGRHHYTGIKAEFDIKNGAGIIVSHSYQCGSNWPGIHDGIKHQLQQMQEQVNEDQAELKELRRLDKVAHEIVGAEVSQ